jgi:hypothetical protein
LPPKPNPAPQPNTTNSNPTPRAQRDHLSAKLQDVEARLSDAKADKRQSERDRRMAKTAADLKREIPGAWASLLGGAKMAGPCGRGAAC